MFGVRVELVPFVAVGRFPRDRARVRFVRRNEPAVLTKSRVLEEPEIMTCVVNGSRHQNRRTPVVIEPRFETEILDDTGKDPLFAFRRAHQLFHGRPTFAESGLLEVVQTFCFLLKPSIDRLLGRQTLRDITSLVFEIQHHFILHRLMEFIRVDVSAEHVPRHLFVFPKKRCACESHKNSV